MRTRIIFNPGAGSADEVDALHATIDRLPNVTLRETTAEGDATRFAAEALAAGFDLIVAAGGDGTINEVVNGLSVGWERAALGIVPLGTGNDFVRTLGIPSDVGAAVDILAQFNTRPIDVVCVESDATRYFVNVSAGGFSGLVNERLTPEMKSSWGPLAYLRAAAAALPDLTGYHTTIQFDDEEPEKLLAYNLIVANARYVAGGVPIAPQAEPDDGELDVIIVPATSLPRLATLAPQIMLGRHLDSADITYRRARKLRVDSQPGMWFNTDGELVGNEPATFTVLPRVLRVCVSADPGEASGTPEQSQAAPTGRPTATTDKEIS
ncbi:MAG TPA: diacylglycerol kinase family protein [Herpetosiphonaceae bacterium]|nr:diacylglycerol kinase family protein [Herpetosiphonaceae bacterium]